MDRRGAPAILTMPIAQSCANARGRGARALAAWLTGVNLTAGDRTVLEPDCLSR